MFSRDVIRVDTRHRVLALDGLFCPCAIGKGGGVPATDKREGDGATPTGVWPVRGVLLRPDRIALTDLAGPLLLPWRWIRPDDGWCDDAADTAYNRPVHLPRPTSHERLGRDDQAYDVIVVLGHNDTPPQPGLGSAIFFHQWVIGPEEAPKATEGCVAIAPEPMRAILPLLRPGMVMRIG
jgi:L,D-peptidoglycan transpeptidase YkuD (ErfK/YbiS/YcfS/YnhG family)